MKKCYLLFLTFDLPEEKHLKVVLFSGTLQKVIYKCYTNLKYSTVTTLEQVTTCVPLNFFEQNVPCNLFHNSLHTKNLSSF